MEIILDDVHLGVSCSRYVPFFVGCFSAVVRTVYLALSLAFDLFVYRYAGDESDVETKL